MEDRNDYRTTSTRNPAAAKIVTLSAQSIEKAYPENQEQVKITVPSVKIQDKTSTTDESK